MVDPWWRGAVIYQIYPRSFFDASGDGIGDLSGLIQRLDYVKALGVDAVWISPFFKSPMNDFGYDVEDYLAVDPIFGTIEDFDRLLEEAHARDLKVLIDLVLSHTSDRHPWFLESRKDRNNTRADWYVWCDPKPDGSPPNNWLSVFGGSAWRWEPRRRQYYFHNFLESQPDLNLHNPDVVKALLRVAEFWLDKGVDGFRLDAVSHYTHDRELRDNPPRDPSDHRAPPGTTQASPYALQAHVHDKGQPETITVLEQLRRLTDRYEERTMLAEVSDDHALESAACYVQGNDRLHMAYTFDLLGSERSAEHIRDTISRLERDLRGGWLCWSFNNHDVPRVVSRWQDAGDPDARARVWMALLLSLRGTVCLYQGEELGLAEADVPFELVQDPYGKYFWPEFRGRDGCRTPHPWAANRPHAGFTTGEPWLPIPSDHQRRAVDAQERAPGSVLNAYRRFIDWRKKHTALVKGDIRFFDTPEPISMFERACSGQLILAVFNLGAEEREILLPAEHRALVPLEGHGFSARVTQKTLVLPPHEAYFAARPVVL